MESGRCALHHEGKTAGEEAALTRLLAQDDVMAEHQRPAIGQRRERQAKP